VIGKILLHFGCVSYLNHAQCWGGLTVSALGEGSNSHRFQKQPGFADRAFLCAAFIQGLVARPLNTPLCSGATVSGGIFPGQAVFAGITCAKPVFFLPILNIQPI